MAKTQGNVLNISSIVAVPILKGRIDKPMWTGIVSSKQIDQYLIPDENLRTEFLKLVLEYEKSIKEYRKFNVDLSKGLLTARTNFQDRDSILRPLLKRIMDCANQFKSILNNPNNGIDMDLFWVRLCKDYEEILRENQDELASLDGNAGKSLKNFYKVITERDILFREIYVPSTNEYRIISFPTEAQERNLKRGNKNPDKVAALVQALAEKANVSAKEGIQILENVMQAILVTDLFIFLKNERYAQMAYVTLFKNYLIRKGFTSDEIEAMEVQELSDTVLETYNTNGLEHHKSLITKAITDAIYFIDLDKLMLIVASRHLNSFEELKVIQGVQSAEINKNTVISRDISKDLERGDITDLTEDFVADPSDMIEHKIIQGFDDELIIQRMRETEVIVREILRQRLIGNSSKIKLEVYGEQYDEFSRVRLEEMLAKYCDGIYLSGVMQANLIYKAFLNPDEMSKWSEELIRRIDFKDKDLIILSLNNFENLKLLQASGKIDKDKIVMMLQLISDGTIEDILHEMREIEGRENAADRMLENTSRFLQYLVDEGFVTPEDLKLFYDRRIIKMEDLEKLENSREPQDRKELIKQIGNSIDLNEVLRAYKDFIEHKLRYERALDTNDPDVDVYKDVLDVKRREKDIQMTLFSKYKLADLSEEERAGFMDEFLLTYCLDFEHDDDAIVPETLRQMYKDGIVKFEEISSISNDYLQTVIIDLMFVRGELSLADTKKLRDILPLEALVAVINAAMVNSAITQSQKVSLIMNIFHNGAEDQEIADKFLSQLHADNYVGVDYKELIKLQKHRKRRTEGILEPHTPKDASKEWVYPKYVKWEFLSALDKDAIVTVYANGYVEAYSRKLGVRIIEKYFDVDREGKQFDRDAYGCATFIISESVYQENLEMLVDSHSRGELLLNPKTLSAIVEREDRIRHNTHSVSKNWMRTMAKYFEIDLDADLELIIDERYSKEELEYIRETIRTYENVYVDRNEER